MVKRRLLAPLAFSCMIVAHVANHFVFAVHRTQNNVGGSETKKKGCFVILKALASVTQPMSVAIAK